MESNCGKCQGKIAVDPIICDGICGSHFHIDCIRRNTRQAFGCSFTCSSCSEIKPCHILKAFLVMNTKIDSMIDKSSDLEQSIASLKSNINVLFSDREVILSRIDQLNDTNGSLAALFSKFADLANKNNSLTKQLENTLSDINVFPDLSLLKEEITILSDSIRGIEERIRAMIKLPALHTSSHPSVPHIAFTDLDSPSKCSPTSKTNNPNFGLRHHLTLDDRNSTQRQHDVSPPGSHSIPIEQQISSPVSTPSADLINNPQIIPGCDISWVPTEALETTSLYIGKCVTSTTTESIKNFVSTQLKIPLNSVRCRKLVSPSRPIEDYSFVSFKVDIPSSHGNLALSHNWPGPSRVSLFLNRNRSKDSASRSRPPHSKNDHNPPPSGVI